MFVLVILLLVVLVLAMGLCSAAQRGDELVIEDDLPAFDPYDALSEIAVPHCLCGAVLRIEEWHRGSCGACHARPRLLASSSRRAAR